MSQLCLRLKMTACSRNDARAAAMSCMNSQARTAHTAMNGTQISAAFCAQIVVVCPALSTTVCGAKESGPQMGIVTTSGARNCTLDTPRLPKPALTPRAEPLRSFGKKKLMFAIDELKLPPPKPHRSASVNIVAKLVAGSCTDQAMPRAGIRSDAVEIAVKRRPPTIGTMNE